MEEDDHLDFSEDIPTDEEIEERAMSQAIPISESLKLDESLKGFRKPSDPRYVTRLSRNVQLRKIREEFSEEDKQELEKTIMKHNIINGWEGIVVKDYRGNNLPFSFDEVSIFEMDPDYAGEIFNLILYEPGSRHKTVTLHAGRTYKFSQGTFSVKGKAKEDITFAVGTYGYLRGDPKVIYPRYIELDSPYARGGKSRSRKSRRMRKGRKSRKSRKSRK
jgi:hypothetical protein